MQENYIKIRGASSNNLKHISLDIPKNRLVVFAGVSGSGKTSLVKDTIAAEAMRQLQNTFPSYVRNRMAHYDAPDAEQLDYLQTPILVDQHALRGSIRSTVGTLTDTAPLLRLLFSRCAVPSAGTSNAYSFNDPAGMCPECGGLGYVAAFDMERIIDRNLSLNEGAIRFPQHQVGACLWQVYANSGLYDPDKPMRDYTEKEWDDFLHGSGTIVTIHNTTGKVWGSSYQQTYEGFQDRIERLYLKRNINLLGKGNRKIVEELTVRHPCSACGGKRLNEKALQSRLLGYSIADLGNMELQDVIPVLEQISDPVGAATAAKIVRQLRDVCNMGLGYLNLDRPSDTLSGGEMQRLKMVRHLGSSLVGLMYIFDEPCAGLHPQDIDRLKRLLIGLRDRGNSVLVVEHNEQILEIADQIIELGPHAGKCGGTVVFQGTPAELLEQDTCTARILKHKRGTRPVRRAEDYLEIRNASLHNLKNISVKIPKNCLVSVTGVAGAGKSSLISDELIRQYPDVVQITQDPIGQNSRSTPASYTGILDEIRKLMGSKNHVSANLFSFNSKGACPMCRGKGTVATDMAFMDAIEITCEACGGSRYSDEALSYRYREKNILELLSMTVDEALDFFSDIARIHTKLKRLQEVGLGYMTLGQPVSTLSGGECQRIKLASRLADTNGIYVLDEPTTGLHGADVETLLTLFDRMVDQGNTVIVAEHNPDVIVKSDWVIDLGPGGGKEGGSILFEGTPEELLRNGKSATAECMRKLTGGHL